MNTFGKRFQSLGQQSGHTPEPYASTMLVHGPALEGTPPTRGNAAITLKSLNSRSSCRYSNAAAVCGTSTLPSSGAHELEHLLQAAQNSAQNCGSIRSSSGDSASFGRRSGLSAASQHTDCSSCNGGRCCSDECPSEPIYNTVAEDDPPPPPPLQLVDNFSPKTGRARTYTGQHRPEKKQHRLKNNTMTTNSFNSLQQMDDSITLPSYTKPSLFSPNSSSSSPSACPSAAAAAVGRRANSRPQL